jgi:hypothetical protein
MVFCFEEPSRDPTGETPVPRGMGLPPMYSFKNKGPWPGQTFLPIVSGARGNGVLPMTDDLTKTHG